MTILENIISSFKNFSLPKIETMIGKLYPTDEKFCTVLSFIDLENFISRNKMGRPEHDRTKLFAAFIAKPIYSFPTTETLILGLRSQPRLRHLCGWEYEKDIPSSSTFSRAFTEFARDETASKVHEQLIKTHLSSVLLEQISYDGTSISVPEKNHGNLIKPEVKRLDIQPFKSIEENIAELPILCNNGNKKDSKGYKHSWRGYNFHIATSDSDIPIRVLLTSASLHDSQAVIPLMQLTYKLVASLYDIMDKGYDASVIRNFSKINGHVPIIPPKDNTRNVPKLDPPQKLRYKMRSSAERVNSLLKEQFGGRWCKVKGHAKVLTHLMFGIICITINALIARSC